jgi:hypothetical protein
LACSVGKTGLQCPPTEENEGSIGKNGLWCPPKVGKEGAATGLACARCAVESPDAVSAEIAQLSTDRREG